MGHGLPTNMAAIIPLMNLRQDHVDLLFHLTSQHRSDPSHFIELSNHKDVLCHTLVDFFIPNRLMATRLIAHIGLWIPFNLNLGRRRKNLPFLSL